MDLKPKLIRAGLDALYGTGAYRALSPLTAGIGVIFTLHRFTMAEPGRGGPPDFAPNRILEVSRDFLAAAIDRVRAHGLDIVSIDEAERRIVAGDGGRFAVFTIDDGYRDTAEIAWPVFRAKECPFTVYVATGLIDRTISLWWIALERVIEGSDTVDVALGGEARRFDISTVEQKCTAFGAIYWALRAMEEEEKLRSVADLCDRAGLDTVALAGEVAMGWDDVTALDDDPLVTIGAHTVDHPALARVDETTLHRELIDGRARLAQKLGRVPRHLAYPYGDAGSAGPREFAAARALGFATAVTTRKGVIHAAHGEHLTALPRVSLNGDYQDLRYVDVFVSGAPFALMRGFRRVDAA